MTAKQLRAHCAQAKMADIIKESSLNKHEQRKALEKLEEIVESLRRAELPCPTDADWGMYCC